MDIDGNMDTNCNFNLPQIPIATTNSSSSLLIHSTPTTMMKDDASCASMKFDPSQQIPSQPPADIFSSSSSESKPVVIAKPQVTVEKLPLVLLDDNPSARIDELPDELFHEEPTERLCALCRLGERSALGQGDIVRFEANTMCTADENGATGDDDLYVPPEDSNIARLCLENAHDKEGTSKLSNKSLDFVDELDNIGQQEVLPFSALLRDQFFYVHRMCANWSVGLKKKPDGTLSNIQQIVAKSLKRKCWYCGQYGASVVCKIRCPKMYHLPCAIAAGCLLLIERYTAFCIDHLTQVSLISDDSHIECRHCSIAGDLSKLITCSTCWDHYHTACVGIVNNLPGTRSGWNCKQCQKCQICHSTEIEGRSLKCEQCQKVYHATCMRPVVTSIPKFGWKCNRCRVCTDCGSRTPGSGVSSRWHCHYSVCDSCYQQRNKGFSCPICQKAYRAAAYKEMVKCKWCNRFVHSSCDGDADLMVYHAKKEKNPDYDYICLPCKMNSQRNRVNQFDDESCSQLDNAGGGGLTRNDSVNSDNSWTTDNGNVDGLSKTNADFGISRGKPSDFFKLSKKSVRGGAGGSGAGGSRDIQRGGKFMLPKTGLLTQFGRKRGTRGRGNAAVFSDRLQSQAERTGKDMDNGSDSKLILFSADDKFILLQDMCVMCGSFGLGEEGALIPCVQCGQCYHPYCVNIKLTQVMVEKGWRCLDCTICEGCGQKNDEARLILCDDCDISYHIYCINPPLETVPQGNWKCNWCAMCQKCGKKTPGKNSQWMNGFTECGPCASQSHCSVCAEQYVEDQLIIECANCDRWLHGSCDGVFNVDDAEKCNNDDYNCILCRPRKEATPHVDATTSLKSSSPTVHQGGADVAATTAANVKSEHWIDDVCVTEHGFNLIKSLGNEIKRKRKIRSTNEVQNLDSGILAAIESVVAGSEVENAFGDGANKTGDKRKLEDYKDGMPWAASEGSPPEGFSISTNEEGKNVLRKKRQRNLQKVGIGGFMVRNRTVKTKQPDATTPEAQASNCAVGSTENIKKKKPMPKKVRNKVVETFPPYLQEAFFGKSLLESSNNKPLALWSTDSSDELDKKDIIPAHEIKLEDDIMQDFNLDFSTNIPTEQSTLDVNAMEMMTSVTTSDKMALPIENPHELPEVLQ